MYYPSAHKVIVNFFMTKDQSVPRRNSVNWHYARDDYMFTMIKVVSRHEDTQLYGAILPNELTNENIRNSKSYKEYYAIALGAEPPKTKARVKKKQVGSDKTNTPLTVKGKRLKTSTKAAKPAKKKQPAKTSKAKAAQKSSEEDDDDEVNVSDDDNADNNDNADNDDDANNDDDVDKDDVDDDVDNQDDENPDDTNQDDNDEQTDSDNDGDDFVHPKLSTHDDEARQDDEEEEMDEEPTHEEDEANKLYRDVNVNLKGRDTEMTDAPLPNVEGTQVTEDTHVIITAPVNPEGQQQSSSVTSGFVPNMLNPSPNTGIDSIFTLNTEATSLVDVSVTTIVEPPLLSATTLPPPPTPLITHLQKTPVPTPTNVPSSSLQDLPNIGSLFGFDHRLKTLENNFSEFNQKNQFVAAVSLIPSIVDAYLANKMHEAVITAVKLQSERLRDEAQAENADFLNKLDDNIKKIIKDQVKEQVKAQVSKILPKIEKTVNEQLEVEVMTRSSTESKISVAIAANLSELELKKILIDKMESNKLIYRSDEQNNLYKALVDAYKSDKLILDTYGDTVWFKRCRDDEDKDEEPSVGSNRRSKRRRDGKEPESTSAPKEKTPKTTEGSKSHYKSVGESAQAEEPMHTAKDLEEPAHQEFETGVTEDQPNKETPQILDWFQRPTKLPSLDRDWNKTVPDAHGPVQPWLSSLAYKEDPRESFNELMDTPLDFLAFVMNRLKVDTLTPELLTGPTFELIKGSFKSLVELEYLFEEVYKATTNKLDWDNPEGQQYPHDLRKSLPLIPNSREMYGHIKWIDDLSLQMWSQVPISYDKYALWGISHWERKRQQFYGFAANRESARDVYSKRRIIAVTKLEIVDWHNYKHLDWITLRIQDIEDMRSLLFKASDKSHVKERPTLMSPKECFHKNVVIRRRVEDLQLGVRKVTKIHSMISTMLRLKGNSDVVSVHRLSGDTVTKAKQELMIQAIDNQLRQELCGWRKLLVD
ncbi:hypothetical protein Tco_0627946 [Tanacetum coccineum]|uniref:Uncharacterized protein n=1 Tax=Tanacetum coccineum TaxID=301880 RepID=A0ABQ4WNY1_9ASTR